jgi:hypothetical protein
MLGFCVRADLMPCVGVNDCVLLHGNQYVLQGISTPYEELQTRCETAEAKLKEIAVIVELAEADINKSQDCPAFLSIVDRTMKAYMDIRKIIKGGE